MGLIGEAKVLGYVCEAVSATNPVPGQVDALVELPGVRCHAGDGTERPDQLVAAHAGQDGQRVQGGTGGGPGTQMVQGRPDLLGQGCGDGQAFDNKSLFAVAFPDELDQRDFLFVRVGFPEQQRVELAEARIGGWVGHDAYRLVFHRVGSGVLLLNRLEPSSVQVQHLVAPGGVRSRVARMDTRCRYKDERSG